ncbi:DUF2201 family putative metallopeptidase [Burkholderia cenocepacia]|uniref:vWA domain-containing protein n=1 Tax=Burkholderia cenocepacia TaxID=95486 RepID=UPI002236B2A1|nr:VWA-like domain-containing protein [Burkholderia cenocepacia]
MIRARSDMVADQPFFGMLALRLELKEDASCTGVWSDGVSLGYNPAYVDTLRDVELCGLVAATVFKVVAGHPWRQDSREAVRWNKACALVSHSSVVEAGFRLPADAILDAEFDGRAAEFVYQQLPPEPEPPEPPEPPESPAQPPAEPESGGAGGGEGDPDGDAGSDDGGEQATAGPGAGAPNGEGSSSEGPSPALISEIRPAPVDQVQLEEEWKQAAYDATFMQGNLPGGVLQVVDDVQKSRVNWRSALWTFTRSASGGGRYTLSKLNRRYQHLGLTLPGRKNRRMKSMVIVRDTSSSMWAYLSLLNGELFDIIATMKPDTVYVLDVDAAVQRVQTVLGADDTMVEKDMAGGGGTNFCPAFEWVEQEGVEVACLIYLTDLLGRFPEQEPPYPVMWAVPEGSNNRALPPFGEMVELELE